MYGELLHTGLVAQDATLGTFTTGVYGQHSQSPTLLFQQVDAKLIDAGGLTSPWHTTDADAYTIAAIRQTFVDDLLRLGLMVGVDTLYQGHRLTEDGDVALDDTLNHLSC